MGNILIIARSYKRRVLMSGKNFSMFSLQYIHKNNLPDPCGEDCEHYNANDSGGLSLGDIRADRVSKINTDLFGEDIWEYVNCEYVYYPNDLCRICRRIDPPNWDKGLDLLVCGNKCTRVCKSCHDDKGCYICQSNE